MHMGWKSRGRVLDVFSKNSGHGFYKPDRSCPPLYFIAFLITIVLKIILGSCFIPPHIPYDQLWSSISWSGLQTRFCNVKMLQCNFIFAILKKNEFASKKHFRQCGFIQFLVADVFVKRLQKQTSAFHSQLFKVAILGSSQY